MAKNVSDKRKARQVNLNSGSENELDIASFQKKFKPTRPTFTPLVGGSTPVAPLVGVPGPKNAPPTPRETPRQDGFVFAMPSGRPRDAVPTKTPSKSRNSG